MWEKLIAHPARRSLIENDLPELPLDYFNYVVPLPEGWFEQSRCSYLWFSNAYLADAQEARRRGWSVRHLPGNSMTMVTRPRTVARELSWKATELAAP